MIISRPSWEDVPALRALWKEAFGDGDAFLDGFFKTAFSTHRASIARIGSDIVGMLYWFDCEARGERCAYIYAVATAKAQRGQGVCGALMEDTHRLLRDSGYSGAVLVPGSAELFRFYDKLGYKICSLIDEIAVTAGMAPIPIHEIDKEEYARLRRKFLPAGGVVQEMENLDFLKVYARFYAGDGFVLAGYKNADTFTGIELLGNTNRDHCAAITRALGAKAAHIRVPGDRRPFAMHYPLSKESCAPKYFGLAFD